MLMNAIKIHQRVQKLLKEIDVSELNGVNQEIFINIKKDYLELMDEIKGFVVSDRQFLTYFKNNFFDETRFRKTFKTENYAATFNKTQKLQTRVSVFQSKMQTYVIPFCAVGSALGASFAFLTTLVTVATGGAAGVLIGGACAGVLYYSGSSQLGNLLQSMETDLQFICDNLESVEVYTKAVGDLVSELNGTNKDTILNQFYEKVNALHDLCYQEM